MLVNSNHNQATLVVTMGTRCLQWVAPPPHNTQHQVVALYRVSILIHHKRTQVLVRHRPTKPINSHKLGIISMHRPLAMWLQQSL